MHHTVQRLLSAGILLVSFTWSTSVYAATPVRRVPIREQPAESCEGRVQRFAGGPGRQPGATVIPVDVHLQVKNQKGAFVSANTPETIARIAGDRATFRILVTNRSFYEVRDVEILHTFIASTGGPDLSGIDVVEGADYRENRRTFTVDRIPRNETAIVTFHVFFTDDLSERVAKSSVRLEDFSIGDPERLLPARTPEIPFSRRAQTTTVVRVGIGMTDIACFKGAAFAQAQALPPALTPSLNQGEGEEGNAAVRVEMNANRSEAQAGSALTYTVIVANTGERELRDVVLDDRFSSSELRVVDAGGGDILAAGIQWQRAALSPSERWVVRYRADILPDTPPGTMIASTATVFSEDLRETPTTLRMASAHVAVLGLMPKTGADFGFLILFFQVALGSVIAFLLAYFALRIAVRIFE